MPSFLNEVNKTEFISISRTYSTSTNFKRGNYIELANGTLRRVEDMRTEDFIQCAERSPNHQLAESTVVKVNTSLTTTAVITFSYDGNCSKVIKTNFTFINSGLNEVFPFFLRKTG